jgi:hypothetical protein
VPLQLLLAKLAMVLMLQLAQQSRQQMLLAGALQWMLRLMTAAA